MDSKAPKFHNEALELWKCILKENNKICPMDTGNRLGCSRTSVQQAMKILLTQVMLSARQ